MKQTEPLQSHDPEAQVRAEAINRYLVGEKPTEICRGLKRSRTWFYKTLRRYQQGGRAGLNSRSRRPQHSVKQTDEKLEAAIVRIRKAITEGEDPALRYGNIGADTIASELETAGLAAPSIATINRILRKHGLQQSRQRRNEKRKLPADYPWPDATQPNQLHLLDFVTRATGSIRRVYSCNLLDQTRQWPYMRLITAKTRQNVADFLVAAWQDVGLPDALHMDNDTVWRGSSSGKRSFSFIVRLCLLLGVEVIFTPPYTPEANPLIESFNGIWDRNFWQRATFASLQHMTTELAHFETWCRYRRPLREHDRLSPSQLNPDFVPVYLPDDFARHHQPSLPLSAGFVHFIRFMDKTGTFSILNESWTVSNDSLVAKTIRATIDIQQQQLTVYHQANPQAAPVVVQRFAYEVAENVEPVSFDFQRSTHSLWPEPEVCDY